jgi:hypothetical protein
MRKIILPFLLFFTIGSKVTAQQTLDILSEKQRAKVIDKILDERFTTVLPQIM